LLSPQNLRKQLCEKNIAVFIDFALLILFVKEKGIPYAQRRSWHDGDSLTISALLFRPVFGSLIDGRGRKFVLVAGALIFVAVSVVYNMADTVFLLIMLRVVNGIGFSAHTGAAGIIASDLTPKSRLAEGIGYYGISIIIGTAVGPSLGLCLSNHSGYKFLFPEAAGFTHLI
jgi:MFS family permease